jgi:hypothetical protein
MVPVLVKDKQSEINDRFGLLSGEVVVSCPNCTALQTLWFAEGRLTPTRKFTQSADEVFHDCGSAQPCRLYRIY